MANLLENLNKLNSLRHLVPEYNGDQATLSDFISACNFISEQIEEADPAVTQGFLFVVKNKLVDKAKQFISSRNINDWPSIRQLLIGHFGDCRDTESLLRDLTACIQKHSETPRTFVQRIENLLTKLRNTISLDETLTNPIRATLNNSHERIALKTLLAGLSDPIGSIIRSQRPASIDEAIQLIIEEENIYYLKNKNSPQISKQSQKIVPRANFSNDQRRDYKSCNYCKKIGHTINECRKRQFNNRNQNEQNTSHGFSNNHQPNYSRFGNNNTQGRANFNPNRPNQNPPYNFARNSNSGHFNRPSVNQRNQAVNHLNSQGEADLGNPPRSFQSLDQEQISQQLEDLTF